MTRRLPIVNSDDGTWGTLLRDYLLKEHHDTGSLDAANGGHKTVTIIAGTATAGTAPLKFTSGTLLTTPEAGAIEFNTDRLYFTQTTSTTRKTVAAYDDTGGATGDIYYRNGSGYFTRIPIGSANDRLIVTGGVPAWSGALTVSDSNFTIQDNGDATKQLKFEASSVVSGTTSTLTVPNASTTIVGTDTAQTLTNKTIALGSNTVSGTKAQFDAAVTDADLARSYGGPSGDVLIGASGVGGVLWSHPETAGYFTHIMPMVNDLGYCIERGGSVAVTKNGTPVVTDMSIAFYPDVATVNFATPLVNDVFVFEVTFPSGFVTTWGTRFGIATSTSFHAKDVTIEIYDSVAAQWITAATRTNDSIGYAAVTTSGGGGGANAISKMRFTCTNFDTNAVTYSFRVLSIFVVRYNSPLMRDTFVDRKGGNLYGTNAAPPTLTVAGSDTNIGLNLVPKGTGTVNVGGVPVTTTTGAQTLSNKTISGSSNTISNIAQSSVTNLTTDLGDKVTGPASVTDNRITRYDGTTGKLVQDSAASIDDSGNATFGIGLTGSMATPASVDTGTSYGSNTPGAAGNLKVKVYTGYGLGVSGGLLEIQSGGAIKTFISGTQTMQWSSTGTYALVVANTTGAVVSVDGTQTLTAKSINLASNTLTGTTAEFNTALSDGNFATLDGNNNFTADTFIKGTTSTPTAAGTTTLDINSTQVQIFTGSTTQNVRLSTTSVVAGQSYTIVNQSSGAVTVQSSDASTVKVLSGSTTGVFTAVVNTPTNNTSHWIGNVLTAGKILSASNNLTLAGTDSTTMTFPSTSATIARTDAANTFTGASTASAWVLTSPTITAGIIPTSNDGAALGSASNSFSDLFLASGALINIANSNWVATHSSGILTVSTGDLRVTTAGTSATSVVTVDGAQTLGNKTLTTPVLTGLPTGTGVASAATASTLAARNSNANLLANAFIPGFRTQATSAGTLVLTIADAQVQEFTGATTHTVRLPTTSVVAGAQYSIINSSSGSVTVQSSGSNTISILLGGSTAMFTAVVATPTTAANWDSDYVAAGAGDVVGQASSVDDEIALFSGTGGKTIKRATTTGIIKATSGVISAAVAGTDYYNPAGTDVAVTDGGTGRSTGTTAYSLVATGTTATGAQQTLANGAITEILIGGGASALPVWTAATGTLAPVRANTPTITTPVLTGLPTGSGVSSTATVSTLAARDSSANLAADTFIKSTTSTATSAGTLVMDINSTQVQILTGSTTHNVNLPTTSVVAGQTYTIINQSSGIVTVRSSGANNISTLVGGSTGVFIADTTTPTTAADWVATGAGVTETLTNKTIDAANNTISNLDVADFAASTIVTASETIASNNNDTTIPTSAAVKAHVDSAESALITSNDNLVSGGDMQTAAKWTNAWGTHSTEQSPVPSGYSRKLTSTGATVSTEYLSVTHNGTGTEIYFQGINSRRINVAVLIRKHASNTGGGNMVIRCVPINLDGTDATVIDNTNNATSGMSNSSFTIYTAGFQVGSPRLGYKIRIGFDASVPSGDIFYIGGLVITDVTGAVMAWTSDTLTSKTISGSDNTITDIDASSITNVTDLMGSEMVIGGDFQTASYWTNAWGVQSADQSLISGGESRKLTSTAGGVTVDRIGLLHDGTGTNIGMWANQPRAHTWRVAIRKHASNAGGGNIILRTRWTDYAGAGFTTTTTYSESVLSNSSFSTLAITHTTTTAYHYFHCYIEMESIPSGDIFYIGSASIVDNSGAVTPNATQTLTNKTLTSPSVHNFTEGVIAIGSVGSTNTLDLTSTNTAGGTGGTVLTATLTSATPCTFTMPTATAGKSFTLMLKQPAAGSATSATFTSVKWNVAGSPTITATLGKMDILSFFADGSSWYGSYTQGYTP